MEKEEKRKKLIGQILKFAVVGGLSFVIDFVITLIMSAIFRGAGFDVATAATIGSVFGFCISLIFNYFMSMKFVFARKDDMDRRAEFLIFLVLSVIGLGINAAIMNIGVNIAIKLVDLDDNLITAGVKIIATGIVMVYNFISRKLTLEKKEDTKKEDTNKEDAEKEVSEEV